MNASAYRRQRDQAHQVMGMLSETITVLEREIKVLQAEVEEYKGRVLHLANESDTHRRMWMEAQDRLTELQQNEGGLK